MDPDQSFAEALISLIPTQETTARDLFVSVFYAGVVLRPREAAIAECLRRASWMAASRGPSKYTRLEESDIARRASAVQCSRLRLRSLDQGYLRSSQHRWRPFTERCFTYGNVAGGGKAVVEIVVRYCEPACRHAESDGCVEQARASVVIKEVPYESEEYARAQNTRSRRAETKRMRKYRAAVRGREETYGRLWPAISRSMDEISLTLHLSSHKQSSTWRAPMWEGIRTPFSSYDRGVGTIQQFLIFIRGTPFSPKILL